MKHPFIKKFIFIYLSAVVLVLLYFIIKTLFFEEKEIKLKQFNTSQTQDKKVENLKDSTPETKFLLLPKKD